MNKPKSIRVAILTALSDGGIMTIDDLKSATDETETRLKNNLNAAIHDQLVKRTTDETTHLLAYQITALGRTILHHHQTGKRPIADNPEPETTAPVVAQEPNTTTPKAESKILQPSDELGAWRLFAYRFGFSTADDAMQRLTSQSLTISSVTKQLKDANRSLDKGFAAAVGQLLSELNLTRIKADELERSNNHLASAHRQLQEEHVNLKGRFDEAARHDYKPVGFVIQRPVQPLIRTKRLDKAKQRALMLARKEGRRAQVLALVAIGSAAPGAEWQEGKN